MKLNDQVKNCCSICSIDLTYKNTIRKLNQNFCKPCWNRYKEKIHKGVYHYFNENFTLFMDETDNDNERVFYGIEIETYTDDSLNYFNGLHTLNDLFFEYKKDGSLKQPNSIEIVTQPMTKQFILRNDDIMRPLYNLKRSYKFHETVENYGLHIHRTDTLKVKEKYRLIKFFFDNQKYIKKFISDRTTFGWCEFPKREEYLKDFVDFPNHEQCIGFTELPTMELRIFLGTFKKSKILSRIEFLDSVIDYTQQDECNKINTWLKFSKKNRAKYPYLYNYMVRQLPMEN